MLPRAFFPVRGSRAIIKQRAFIHPCALIGSRVPCSNARDRRKLLSKKIPRARKGRCLLVAIHQTVTPVVRRLDVYLKRKIEEGGRDVDPCGVSFFFFLRPNSRSRITSPPGRLTPARGRINKFRVGGT